MGQDLRNALDFSVWQTAFAKPCQPFLMSALQENFLDEFFERPSILPARFGCFESVILQQTGAFDYLHAENLPIVGRRYTYFHLDSTPPQTSSTYRHLL